MKSSFYTPALLAQFIIASIPELEVRSAVDICCGSWHLISAVQSRWPDVRAVGVDTDARAGECTPPGARFCLLDGREFALECHAREERFDVVVANPPFGLAGHRLMDSGLSLALGARLRGPAIARMETEMFLANALLVSDGGYLAIIVPSSVVEGETFRELRMLLTDQFELAMIVRLPKETFPGHAVNSYVLFMRRCSERSTSQPTLVTSASRCETAWRLGAGYHVEPGDVIQGGWIGHRPSVGRPVAQVETLRGKISSGEFAHARVGLPVLHAGRRPDKGDRWRPTVRYVSSRTAARALPMVQPGDLLINRIGKAAGYWNVYADETKRLISDCLIILRASDRSGLLEFVQKNSTEDGCLLQLVKGTTTRFVTESDLATWVTTGSF